MYLAYDKEFDAIIRCLEHWSHYLVATEFILHHDHEALKYSQGQYKLNARHARWVEYLQPFHFIIKHKYEKLNQGTYMLSRNLLMFQLEACVLGFEFLKSLCEHDKDFQELYESCKQRPKGDFLLQKMDTYSKRLNYVFQHVEEESSRLERSIEGTWLAIIGKQDDIYA